MTDVEVRGITEDEMRDYLRCAGSGFHNGSDVSDEYLAYARIYMDDLSQRLGAFVDGRVCGTTGSFGTELTVPGGATVPMSAVTQVTVLPTHRRRGLLREMMDVQLRDAVARGEIVAMLIAAEWPIYGRFGSGMAIEAAATIVDARTAVFRDPEMHGTIEIVDLKTLRELAPPVFDRHRLRTSGAIHRNAVHWDLSLDVIPTPGEEPSKKRMRVIHRDRAGVVDGYAVYDPKDEWVHNRPNVKLSVYPMIAATGDAEADLWRYLCSIDWVTEVDAQVRSIDEDIRHLFVNGRVARQVERCDNMWVRLLDVPAAMAARRYESPVSLVLDVRDDVFGDGRFRLEGDANTASCTPTTDPSDVTVNVDVLGATYLGGARLAPYAYDGRITETTDGAIAALDRSLRTANAPWATTGF
jgi:predicted acetyltransferase